MISLPPSNGGGGHSLSTRSMCSELSRFTMRATRPSKISPCTFIWSFDPAHQTEVYEGRKKATSKTSTDNINK